MIGRNLTPEIPVRPLLLTALLLPLFAAADDLQVRRFDYQASNAVVSCRYHIDWPVGGVSTQALGRIRFALLTEGWSTPEHQARDAGDNPRPHLLRRATLFAENRMGLDEELGEPSAPWEELADLKYLGPCGGVRVFKSLAYEFTGGAHGNTSVNFLSFDAQGELIPRTAWFIAGCEDALSKKIEAGFRKQKGLAPDAPLSANGFFEDHLPPSHALRPTPAGMEFFYNSYEVASYAAGQPALTLPWEELLDLLSPAARESLKGVLPRGR
jgi:hypothetical protein